MAGKREVLGRMKCPECDFPDAEVKAQKNPALVYRFCPECNAQYFARTPESSARLLAKVGAGATAVPVTVTDTAKPEPKPEQKREAEPVPAMPKKKGTGNALLDLIQGV